MAKDSSLGISHLVPDHFRVVPNFFGLYLPISPYERYDVFCDLLGGSPIGVCMDCRIPFTYANSTHHHGFFCIWPCRGAYRNSSR